MHVCNHDFILCQARANWLAPAGTRCYATAYKNELSSPLFSHLQLNPLTLARLLLLADNA